MTVSSSSGEARPSSSASATTWPCVTGVAATTLRWRRRPRAAPPHSRPAHRQRRDVTRLGAVGRKAAGARRGRARLGLLPPAPTLAQALRHFRIETHGGHGPGGRGARPGAGQPAAVGGRRRRGACRGARRSLGQFTTVELPAYPALVHRRGTSPRRPRTATATFDAGRRRPRAPRHLTSPWQRGTVELAEPYRRRDGPADGGVRRPRPEPTRGLRRHLRRRRHDHPDRRPARRRDAAPDLHRLGADPHAVPAPRALPGPGRARQPGLLRLVQPVEPARLPARLPPAPRLPLGPLLLRDLVGTADGQARKHDRIEEVLELHPTCGSC